MKIWNEIAISECRDELIPIPTSFKFTEPHPYFKLGAPYENRQGIWKLREQVVSRLIKANEFLESKSNGFSLLIYDTWRPIEVQEFMFKRAFMLECKKSGIDTCFKNINYFPHILKKVEKFWAYPSLDDQCPPPHSTGGALDVTFADKLGNIVDMGGRIDQMDETAIPDFYKSKNYEQAIIWNERRELLREIMIKYEFAQHPFEWWHFSYGDQLWAWTNKFKTAIYGNI